MILATLVISCMTASSIHPKMDVMDTLAPFPLYFTPVGKSKSEFVEVDGKTYEIRWSETGYSATFHEVKVEGNGHKDPLIVKVSKLCYLIYSKGKITVRHIVDGGETLFDALFRIPPSPPKPPKDDNGNGEPTPTPGRFEWKP